MQVTEGSSDGQTPAWATNAADGEADERRLLLGRFALVRQIGQGGMGVVYTALDELLGRAVAIKMIRADRAGPVAVARILREAQALARLSHPNVVQIHDVRTADGQLFLAMEYVQGRTLRAWLADRPSRAEVLASFGEAGRGLAAAHAAGLVHRDFKPDNVLVGDDGRVRVVDFGLVAAHEPLHTTLVDTASDADASGTLTRAGAVVGTPAYMAPEQLRGEATDARSDQFAFCVALFEALHGRRPFARDSEEASREAQLRGEVAVPDDREVPTWLRAVLLRGLSVDPARRWPDMPALLAAIARDPQVVRRRRLRFAGLLLLVGAFAVLLGLGAVLLQRRWAREAAEAQAFARLAGLAQAVRRAEADGDAESAEAAFRAFVGEPQHQGTRALTRAWTQRGDQARTAGDSKGALAAYAEAYAGARDPADAAAAMRAMAGVFHATHDGPALARAIATLRASAPATQGDPELAAMAADAALLLRDLPAAADEQRRAGAAPWPWDALAAARRTGVEAWELGPLPPGGPAAFVAVGTEVTLLDEQLRVVSRVATDRSAHLLAAPWLLTHAHGELAVLDPRTPAAPLWSGPIASAPVRALAVDLGGPAPDLLVGFAEPVRGFRRLTGLGGPAAAMHVAHTATDQLGSDLRAAVAGDLDGDGARELIAAFGAWRAYDLRVFALDEGGALALRARRRIGRVPALVAFDRRGERLVAAIKDDRQPNPELFPEPPHTGEPAGVYLLRWTGAALDDVGFVPLRRRDGVTVDGGGHTATAADLDGDGDEELVFPLLGDGRTAMILREDADGWHTAHVGGMAVLAAAELDGDPARELLVALDPDEEVWALGFGDDRVPTLRPRDPDARPVPAALDDPLLAARWTRADELAAVGLPASAAAGLQEAAHFTADRDAQVHLHDRAAELWLAAGDAAAALRLDRAVAGVPALAPAALARQAAALTHLGRFDEAHAAATALLALPGTSADRRAAAVAVMARLSPLVAAQAQVDIDFSAPLDPAWELLMPAALRRDPGGAGLAFTLVTDPSPAARLPLAWDGGPLALEFSADVAALEYAACLRVAVEDASGTPWLGAAVCGRGGGGELTHAALFAAGEPTWHELPLAPAPTGAPRQVHVRVVRFPGESVECTLEGDGAVVRLSIPVGDARPTTPTSLTLGSRTPGQPPTLATGVLRRLTIRSAEVLPAAGEDPARRAAHAIVEGDLAAARDLLALLPDRHPWRALVGDELHDLTGAGSELSAALEDMSCATCPADLALALRTRPALAAALRERAGAAALPLLARVWASLGHHHRRDPATRRGVLAALAGVEALAPDDAAQRAAQRALLGLRARLWEHAGSQARARRDLLAALAVPSPAGDADAWARADLHAELARLLVDADPAASYAHARAALDAAPVVEAMRTRLADTAALAARTVDDPDWRRLLAPAP